MNSSIRYIRDKMEGVAANHGTGVLAGDAHFFDDATTPAKVRQYLDSSKVRNESYGSMMMMTLRIDLSMMDVMEVMEIGDI